jgi:hypothetical protein
MAQTKRKRNTKHRGNAAGVVESRGRTGRKPTAAELDPKVRERDRGKTSKQQRLDRPPSWRRAFMMAPIMALILFLISIVLFRSVASAAAIIPIAIVLYIPLGYYTDKWAYQRRQRRKAQGKA